MGDVIYYLVLLAIVGGGGFALLYVLRAYMAGTTPLEMMMRPKPVPRLEVIDYANVDGKRRLLLIRRDDVEHLIMTGGPVDMVIETGIGEKPRRETSAEVATPIFSRPARMFGQAAAAANPAKEAASGE
jgi:flagellar protein FliO/FliZ